MASTIAASMAVAPGRVSVRVAASSTRCIAKLPVRIGAPSLAVRSSRRSVSVRAASDGGMSFEDVRDKYHEISDKVPPIVTAATLPVVGLGVLCKGITGHDLPGILGTIEYLSAFTLFLGFHSFFPRAKEIVDGGDFSTETVVNVLKRAVDGDSTVERLSNFSKVANKDSPLGQQLADIERKQKEMDALSPEEREKREAAKAALAAQVLKDAQERYSKLDEDEK